MKTRFKAGDEVVYGEKSGNFEEDTKQAFTIEEVNEKGWIWSSQFPSPYFKKDGDETKNFYNPSYFEKSASQIRADKLDDIGI